MSDERRGVFLSVVSPVYGARNILPALCERLDATLSQITDRYEIILVDDRCPQDSWSVLRSLVGQYPNLVILRLSRNFGQHYAITAGVDIARGDWTVIMDCDLQDRPEDIPRLLAIAEGGYDVVIARRRQKAHSLFKRSTSWLYHKLFSLLSGYRMDSRTGTFRIMRRSVVDAFCRMREMYRLFGGMVQWLGFRTAYVEVEHDPRYEGRTSYTLRRLLKLSADGIFAFSNRPLYVSVSAGLLVSGVAGTYGAYHLLRYFLVGQFAVLGWLSTVTLTAFIGGLILLNQGILGIYIGRIYDQVKERPLYVVDEVVRGPGSDGGGNRVR